MSWAPSLADSFICWHLTGSTFELTGSGGGRTGSQTRRTMPDLSNKTLFITGASRGIGKAIARVLAQEGVDVVIASRNMADLEKAARIYEDQVRPAVVSALGDIWNPGIDGDPRLNILHANLSGAAGYYGSRDEFPRQVHPNSNERGYRRGGVGERGPI